MSKPNQNKNSFLERGVVKTPLYLFTKSFIPKLIYRAYN